MPKVPNAYAYRSIRACFKSNILRTQLENYTKISIAPFVLWELTNFAFWEIACSHAKVSFLPLCLLGQYFCLLAKVFFGTNSSGIHDSNKEKARFVY